MKKTILVLLAATLMVSFTSRLTGEETQQHKLFKPANADIKSTIAQNPADEQAKQARYTWANNWKAQKHAQLSAAGQSNIDSPEYVDIEFVDNSAHWQSDSLGNLVWTGACHNVGTSGATFLKVSINVYDILGLYMGTASSYVWGGTNVQLYPSGVYTNAIRPDQYGYFRVWTDLSYASAYYITYSFSYDTYSYYLSNAYLDFNSLYYTNDNGYLKFYGDVENHSASYVTYHTIVSMAALDPTNTFVEDVDWNYVDGATYGASTSAIYPHEIEPFSISYLFALYSESAGGYLAAGEWDEAVTTTVDGEYPFGAFSTPVTGSTVASSVAVTGWALDDTGVSNVKIYRESGGSLIYIGDATFVDGARPDIAAAYPYYPLNTRAGWGYMLLTNFLPSGGNGTFVLHAIASDGYGKSTDLGTSTIYCDNAHAVKPFGAIDTPAPGGTASGTKYRNVGWALTPLPNMIPTNGSTIGVYVNGVKKGNATYNLYRGDIAGFFPGYANSNGAMASYTLNTSPYSNGLHSIFWIATDNAGNADGIGSRYFNISNTLSNSAGLQYQQATQQPFQPTPSLIDSIPAAGAKPVLFKKGFRDEIPSQDAVINAEGAPRVDIHELERVELQLPNVYAGYQAVAGQYKSLPVGSTLDTEKGMFYWQPGPAFLGEFNLVFIMKNPDGTMSKKNVTIAINPNTFEQ
jgi:hypothetical protein